MAQLVKALVAKPDQGLLTGTHRVGKATSPKLSSDTHGHTTAYSPPPLKGMKKQKLEGIRLTGSPVYFMETLYFFGIKDIVQNFYLPTIKTSVPLFRMLIRL